MTVADLIEHLKSEDPDKVVVAFLRSYPDDQDAPQKMDLTWYPEKNNLRSTICIHPNDASIAEDLIITFIPVAEL